MALAGCLLLPAGAFHAPGTPRLVAVVDFRPERLSLAFHSQFRSALSDALRESRIPVTVAFRQRTSLEAKAEIGALEKLRPDIYYATTADIAREVRRVNPGVPIVFSGIVDPRLALPVRSIQKPQGNMTGFVSYAAIDNKRLELLAALHPRIRRIGILVQEGSFADYEFPTRRAFGAEHGLDVIALVYPPELAPGGLSALIGSLGLDALDAPTSQLVRVHRCEIIRAADDARIPISFRSADFVKYGGLLSYEPREFDYPHKAARLVARILQGAAPESIPIEFPSEFMLSINVVTATNLPYRLNRNVLRRVNQAFDGSELQADRQLGDGVPGAPGQDVCAHRANQR